MSDWKSIEEPIAQRRIDKCNNTLVELLGGDNDKQPKIGLCLSGGGWRAMTSAVALLDALSTPLDPSETMSNSPGVKLLDTVSYTFGLSGGSWSLMTTLIGKERNPFHTKPSPGIPITEEDRKNHPWLYGKEHSFDPSIHKYEGLEAIVSKEVVNNANYSKGTYQKFQGIISKVGADASIAAALVAKNLGSTLVERWSNFIANDILHFLDDNIEVPADTEDIMDFTTEANSDIGRDESIKNNVSSTKGDEEDEKGKDTKKKKQPWEIVNDPNTLNKSRHVKMSNLTSLIEDGSFPFVVCSAIANHKGGGSRLYDWVEFSPYYLRNHTGGLFSTAVDDCTAYFAPTDKEKGREPVNIRAHHFMGICGSAFACDVGAVVPASVSKTLTQHINIGNDPIIGRGLSELTLGDGRDFGVCRDAGIDINVPLPPMLQEHQRSFDVIIVMDAGSSSTNAFELWKAVDLGYLELLPSNSDPLEKFGEGENVRVFRGSKGYPTVIYFLGLVKRSTSQIIYKKHMLHKDIEITRNDAIQQLIPTIITELRIAKANLDGQEVVRSNVQTTSNTVSFAPQTSTPTFCPLLSNIGDDYDTEDDNDELLIDEMPDDSSTDVHATGLSCINLPIEDSGFGSVAQSLILNATASNLIHESIDSFQIVEEFIFKSMKLNRQLEVIHAIETTAVNFLIGSLETVQMQEKLSNYRDIIYIMLEMGILVKGDAGDKDTGKLLISDPWLDYFTATAISEHLIPETDKLSKEEALIHIRRHNTISSCTKDQFDNVLLLHHSHHRSRFCRIVGSIIHKMQRKSSGVVDFSVVAVNFISSRVMKHLSIAEEYYQCDVHRNMKRMSITGTTKYDVLEEAMLTVGFHVADFFSEALSSNASKNLTDSDCALLVEFSRMIDALVANKALEPVMTGTTQALLMLEAFSRHRSENLTAVLVYMFRPSGSLHNNNIKDKSLISIENEKEDGFLYRVHKNPKLMQHPEDLLRILAACYSSGRKKHAIINLFKDRSGLEIDRKIALENSFGNVLRYFMVRDSRNPKGEIHLDDHSAVDAILDCRTNYAMVHNHLYRSEAIRVLWSFACATQEYRASISEKCLKKEFFWPFLSSFGRCVKITSIASFVKIERILIYTEVALAKNRIRVNIDVDDFSILTDSQKERVARVNSRLLDMAHNVKEVALTKAAGAMGFAKNAVSAGVSLGKERCNMDRAHSVKEAALTKAAGAMISGVSLGKEAKGAASGFISSVLSKKKK